MNGFTFDAGALIALDRDDRRVLLLIAAAAERRLSITIPATALAQAIRLPVRQVRLTRFMRQPGVRIATLDGPAATAVGRLLALTRTSDIADAHVVLCARRAGQAVVTSDPRDLRRIDPSLTVVEL
ncbi:MAG: PIN domain nuclease [Acidobacteria bacterium]|nr:PIN domain nuclease [Acidobacteriota bacterium]